MTHIRWRARLGWALVVVGALFAMPTVQAKVTVNVTSANLTPLPIAITPLQGQDGASSQVGEAISQIVTRDLGNSGVFRPLDPAAFIQAAQEAADQPRFADWKVLNAQALVTGTVSAEPDGRLKADFRLWDVFEQAQIAGVEYKFPPQNESIRQIAHMISDVIYKQLTGEDGYFNPHRLCRRNRPARTPHQATGHHGSGRVQQPSLARPAQHAGADSPVFAHGAGNYLYGVHGQSPPGLYSQHRDRPPGAARRFSGDELLAPLRP
jgi:hypothetical protein